VRRVNLFSAQLEDHAERPDGFRFAFSRLGPQLGASLVGATIYELQPGQTTFPYHYEYGCEEWLLVVGGRPTLRDPEGQHELEPGDVVCFPEGPEGAHAVTNGTEEPVRVVILSTKAFPAVAVYPDSDKIGVWTGNEADEVMVRRESGVDYWDREA
jgi:uncharacterized cupin superfamily protein